MIPSHKSHITLGLVLLICSNLLLSVDAQTSKVLEGNVAKHDEIHIDSLQGAPRSEAVSDSNFSSWLGKSHPKFKLFSEKMSNSQVVVAQGWLDDSGRILSAFGIPHKTIGANSLTNSSSLRYAQVLIIDCPGIIPLAAEDNIKEFVRSGGTLVTTHLALANCLEDMFPDFVKSASANQANSTRKEVVPAESTGASDEIFKQVVDRGYWKLPSLIDPIQLVGDAHVLVRSPEYARQYTNSYVGSGDLAVSFKYGKGYVLHVVGHVGNDGKVESQIDDAAPAMGISMRQGLIANFVIEGLKQKRDNFELPGH